jgi:hypothetical protein
MPDPAFQDTVWTLIVNTGASDATITGNSGITLTDASGVIPAHGSRLFLLRVTNAGSGTEAVTVY